MEERMEKKIKILGIAPYEALKVAMTKIAENRKDITMDIYIGNMKGGVDIARFHENENYDVIISRGATARLIKSAVHIPVVAVSFSAYDILRAMKLAENYPHKYAIVGFPGITKIARVLCDLLQREIDIVTIYHEEDAGNVLKDLKNRGFSMVICGTVGEESAKEAGLSSILIHSGEESIEEAFDQAVEVSKGYAYMRERKLLYETILEQEGGSVFLFDSNKNLCFSNWKEEGKSLKALLKLEMDELSEEGYSRVHTVKNILYTISGKWLEISGARYALFRLQEEKTAIATNRCGIFYSGKKQAENYFYNSFYGASGAMGALEEEIGRLSKALDTVVLMGEEGSGKDQIACYLYMNSLLCHNTFITVDCELVNDKSWAFLMNGTGSPFVESNQTCYIRNPDKLTETRYRQLQFVLMDRSLHKRNRIICSGGMEKDGSISNRMVRFINQFSCYRMHLPSLRDRKDEIPVLANLYIGRKNGELGKQIIGFEPGGTELLQDYEWPYNYIQLKRILDELTAMTDTSYISRLHVKQLLEKEGQGERKEEDGGAFNFNRTLDEINRDIINRELVRTNGNQTAAAKKLGISRTTLWRYFKE